VTNAAFMPLLT